MVEAAFATAGFTTTIGAWTFGITVVMEVSEAFVDTTISLVATLYGLGSAGSEPGTIDGVVYRFREGLFLGSSGVLGV